MRFKFVKYYSELMEGALQFANARGKILPAWCLILFTWLDDMEEVVLDEGEGAAEKRLVEGVVDELENTTTASSSAASTLVAKVSTPPKKEEKKGDGGFFSKVQWVF